ALLAEYLQGKDDKHPVWPGNSKARFESWYHHAAKLVKTDLEAAGLPYVDTQGQVFDFHALRHQFISNLAAAGVHPKVAQALARHSTITLTMDRYTHLAVANHTAALDELAASSRNAGCQGVRGTSGHRNRRFGLSPVCTDQ